MCSDISPSIGLQSQSASPTMNQFSLSDSSPTSPNNCLSSRRSDLSGGSPGIRKKRSLLDRSAKQRISLEKEQASLQLNLFKTQPFDVRVIEEQSDNSSSSRSVSKKKSLSSNHYTLSTGKSSNSPTKTSECVRKSASRHKEKDIAKGQRKGTSMGTQKLEFSNIPLKMRREGTKMGSQPRREGTQMFSGSTRNKSKGTKMTQGGVTREGSKMHAGLN